ncbi:hypothetical protein ACFLZH_00220 [Patescibacteria group bacterium]
MEECDRTQDSGAERAETSCSRRSYYSGMIEHIRQNCGLIKVLRRIEAKKRAGLAEEQESVE